MPEHYVHGFIEYNRKLFEGTWEHAANHLTVLEQLEALFSSGEISLPLPHAQPDPQPQRELCAVLDFPVRR